MGRNKIEDKSPEDAIRSCPHFKVNDFHEEICLLESHWQNDYCDQDCNRMRRYYQLLKNKLRERRVKDYDFKGIIFNKECFI